MLDIDLAAEGHREYTLLQAEQCRMEMRRFVQDAWHVVEPGTPYVGGPHIDSICDHLTFVSLGDIDDLVINIPPRHSKALPVETPVLTTWGWSTHGALVPGDFVYGPDGLPKRVLAVTEKRVDPCHEITFSGSTSIVASEGHLWRVLRDHGKTPRVRAHEVVSTTGIRTGSRPDCIEVCAPLVMAPQALLIDPYLLGAWLGDGSSDAGNINCAEEDVWMFSQYGHIGTTMLAVGDNRRTQDFHRVTIDGLHSKLRVSGLLGNKHIPDEYLVGSLEQRWALLQGLMDTDGHAHTDGTCSFSNNNKLIIDSVDTLTSSLGLKVRIDERYSMLDGKRFGPHYRVSFVPNIGDVVFRLPRKQSRVVTHKPGIKSRRRYVKKIAPVGGREVSCIQVEGEMYLAGRRLIPTHNSTICAVMWPAWEWTWNPSVQWLFSTYALDLTTRDSVKCRRLIQSPWYQKRYGDVYQLSGDLNQKKRFDNTSNGYRLATAVAGQATGEGGDRIVVDDAHNMKEINSDLKRGSVIDWWRNVMSTRGNNPKRLGRVVIAQRGHHQDLPGHILETNSSIIHLNLPGYFEKATPCRTIAQKNGRPRDAKPQAPAKLARFAEPLSKGELIWEDWRKEEGELLTPKRFGPKEMAKLAEELTEKAFAAQIQQKPSASGGNILREKDWRRWEDTELPPMEMIIQVYDTAFEESEENDFSARTTWGVFDWTERRREGLPWDLKFDGQSRLCAIMLERMNERLAFPDLRADAKRSYNLWKPDRILIEKKASGHSLIQELRRAGLPVTKIKVTDSKISRAHAASLVLERGCIWYVDRRWAREVITQCKEFPSGENDDMVDTVTMMALWLRRRWNAEFTDDETDEINLMRSGKPRKLYG